MIWRFELGAGGAEALEAHHSIPLVALSILLAVLAASTLLPVIERYRSSPSRARSIAWLVAGALAMALGVWAMHFTAMLAHQLPVPVAYNPGLTLVSLVPIFIGSALTLVCSRLLLPRNQRLLLAALALGLGVGAMHYTGMEAMVAPADMRYHLGLFILSILLAPILAWLGLASNAWLMQRAHPWLAYVSGALLLGLAVTSMHYVAMAATRWYPLSVTPEGLDSGLDPESLAVLISISVTALISLLFLAVFLDRRLSYLSHQLDRSDRRFQWLAETSDNGIFTSGRTLDYCNPAMSAITGYSPGELYQMPVENLLGLDPEQALAQCHQLHLDTRITTKFGGERWLHVSLSRMPEQKDNSFVGSVFDVTERKLMEQELRSLAFYDGLTLLPNRTLFMQRLDADIRAQQQNGEEQPGKVLLLVDVNRFKLVNDQFGLSTGDRLLKLVARRLKSALPNSALLARMGGNEFAVLLERTSGAQSLVALGEPLHRAFARSVLIGSQEYYLSLNLGMAPCSRDYTDAEALYRDASLARDAAKQRGPGQSCLFDAEMHAQAQRRLQLERDLRLALERQEFELAFQPIVRLAGGEPLGFEALLRWRGPDGEWIFPGEFIPVAEETGLINPLGDWVLDRACQQISSWNAQRPAGQALYVSVNLSSMQLFEKELLDTVSQAMARHQLAPGLLKLELTESLLVDDNPQVIELLQQLRALGCGVLVDDFGTGYSSLSYLQRFPIDTLKIDQSFVARLDQDSGRHLVSAIIAMARALELDVIAEGVETRAAAEQLRTLGCELGQGYYFARALTVDQATHFLEREA